MTRWLYIVKSSFQILSPSIPSHTHLNANPDSHSTPLPDHSLMTPLGSCPASSLISLIFLRHSSLLCQTSEGSQFCTWLTSPASFQADSCSPEGACSTSLKCRGWALPKRSRPPGRGCFWRSGDQALGSASRTVLWLVSFLRLLDLLLLLCLLFLLL